MPRQTPSPARPITVAAPPADAWRPPVIASAASTAARPAAAPPSATRTPAVTATTAGTSPTQTRTGLGQAGGVEGLSQEIALLRLLIGKHAAGKADLLTVAKGVEVLTRAVRAQHAITDTGGDPVAEAVARVLLDLGGQMGLQEDLP